MKRVFPLLVAPLVAAACGDVATPSDLNVPEPGNAAPVAAGEEVTPDVTYGGCPPSPQEYCAAFHSGSTALSWCTFEACFEMSYGGEIRVVAADELGPFPRTWFVWGWGDLLYASCTLTPKQHKTRVEIPDGRTNCRFQLEIGDYWYHEHFASNPTSGCLAWLECGQDKSN